MRICLEVDKISVEHNGIIYKFSKDEFNRKPREVMGRILNIRSIFVIN